MWQYLYCININVSMSIYKNTGTGDCNSCRPSHEQKQRYASVSRCYWNILKQSIDLPADSECREQHEAGVIHFTMDVTIAFSCHAVTASSSLFHEFQHDALSASPDNNSQDKYIRSSTMWTDLRVHLDTNSPTGPRVTAVFKPGILTPRHRFD